MKKIKKLLAMIMAMTMVLGMAMTVSAAEPTVPQQPTSSITVKGLAAEDKDTTVYLYPAIKWNPTESKWDIEKWAMPYIEEDGNAYKITDAEGLSNAVTGSPNITKSLKAGETEVIFENVNVGAYVIIASGKTATYSPMVAETYKEDEIYLTAEDVTVYAKTSGYELTKEQKIEAEGNKFIARGEQVTFTITTTFPTFDWDKQDNEYKIVDTPTGLRIDEVTSIHIGGRELNDTEYDAAYDTTNPEDYVIDLSSQIKEANAGKRVVIEYVATVTSDEGYSNTANAWKDDVNFGDDDEKGYTGSITIKKYNVDKTKVLQGAEFKVYHATKDAVAEGNVEALWFVKVNEGVYRKALSADENKGAENAATQTVVTGEDGTIKITGLDEGDYWFEETKAPDGYSINTDGIDAEIDLDSWNGQSNISIGEDGSLYLTDTKLASLPSTGGIGTTIFTIGGCAIMIAAAALYFVNRRKSEEN